MGTETLYTVIKPIVNTILLVVKLLQLAADITDIMLRDTIQILSVGTVVVFSLTYCHASAFSISGCNDCCFFFLLIISQLFIC